MIKQRFCQLCKRQNATLEHFVCIRRDSEAGRLNCYFLPVVRIRRGSKARLNCYHPRAMEETFCEI